MKVAYLLFLQVYEFTLNISDDISYDIVLLVQLKMYIMIILI